MSMAHELGHNIPDDDEAFGLYDLPERRESFADFSARLDFEDVQNAREQRQQWAAQQVDDMFKAYDEQRGFLKTSKIKQR